MVERINLLLAANEPALIQKILSELSTTSLNLGKIGSVDCLEDLLSYPDKNEIDILLMDVDYALPDIEGNLRLIQDQFPNKPVVALVDIKNFETARKAVTQGSEGFAVKSELIGSVLECVILQAIDHSKTRALLHESNRQIQNLMDNLPGIAYRCRNDENWTMEFISEGCRMLTGYDAEELLYNNKISYEKLIHPEDRQLVRREIKKALMGNKQYRLEYRICTADNQEKWVWEQGSLIDSKHKIQTLEGFITDISDRRQREFNLHSLIEIGNLIRESSTHDDLGDKVLARIASLYAFSSSAVAKVINQNNSIEFDFVLGGWAGLKHKELKLKECICWKAIQEIKPVIIDSHIDLNGDCQLLQNDNSRYIAVIPLTSGGQLSKLLLFGRNLQFSDNEMQVFAAIGDLISSALARVDLIARLEKQLQRMESLHSVDQAISGVFDISVINRVILDEVRKGLGADAAAIMHFNSLTNTLDLNGDAGFRSSFLSTKKLPISTSLAGKVLMSRSVFEAPDLSNAPIEFQIKDWNDEGFKAYFANPLIVKGKPVGVMEVFFRGPFYPDQEWLKFFESLASQAAVAYDSHHTFSDLQRVKQNLANTYNAALETWSKSLELTNIESQGHIQRVTQLTMKLAKDLGVDEIELPAIERGALLHDIGKLGILDEILLKKGKLSETEWHEIEKHPVIARDLLSGVTLLKDAIDIPFSHHENWDGSGYPQGLKAEAIPKAARIFAVVETYDALLSDKPYRKAWAKEKAIDYLKQEKGKKFDPDVIDAFLASLK